MPPECTATAATPPTLRSAVTNGRALFAEGGDGRGAWARRFRDLMAEHISDMGGDDLLSEAQRSIVRRASTLEVQLEQMEARFSEGPAKTEDMAIYSTMSNTLRRLLGDLGLERRAKDITPDLQTYLASRAAEKAKAA